MHFARAVGAARSCDIASARAAAERLKTLHDALVAMKQGYWAGQVEIQGKAAAAWIDFAEGRRAEALSQMREAAELEAATEKLEEAGRRYTVEAARGSARKVGFDHQPGS